MKPVCSSNPIETNENEDGYMDDLTGEYILPSDSQTESEVEEGRAKRKKAVFAEENERLVKNYFAKIIKNPSVLVKNKSIIGIGEKQKHCMCVR